MTKAEGNAMKNGVSSTVCLMRCVSGQSGQKTLEAEAAEMRQKDSIKNLYAKQRGRERAPGNHETVTLPSSSIC